MASKRPTTIAQYIDAAAPVAKSHLQELHVLLKRIAPTAQEAIKWGNPFYVEPRFLFAFSAHKAHVGFMCSEHLMKEHCAGIKEYELTPRGILKIPYSKPIPKALITRIAKARVMTLKARQDDSFW